MRMWRWIDDNYFFVTVGMDIVLLVIVGIMAIVATRYGITHNWISYDLPVLEGGYRQVLPEGEFAVDLPSDLDVIDGKVVLRHEVHSSLAQQGGLGFRVQNTYVRVFFNDEILFSNHRSDGRLVENGKEWIHFDLSHYSGGVGDLLIELTPVNASLRLPVGEFYIGDQQEVFSLALMKDWVKYLIVILLLTVGCYVLFFRYIYHRTIGMSNSVGMLGIGSICAAFGVFSSTNIVAFDFMPGHTLKVFLFTSMLLSTASIAGYVAQIDTLKQRRMITAMMGVNLTWAIIFMSNNLIYPRQFLMSERLFIYTLSLGTLMYCLYQVAMEVRKGNTSSEVLLWTLSLLVLLSLADIIPRYLLGHTTPVITILGIVSFFVINTAFEIRETSRYYEWAELMNYYKVLARTDKMTGLKNRVCLVEDLAVHNREPAKLTLIFLDVDNLKRVNDSYGHAMGDDMIVTTAKLIAEIFGTLGDCYRISGDEFVCLTTYSIEALEMEMVRFRHEVAAKNEEKSYRYRVSLGFASYDPHLDANLEDTMSRAENEMYEDKRTARSMV